jgi:hypothetical protein
MEKPMKPRIGEVLIALLAMGAVFALDNSLSSLAGAFGKAELRLACEQGSCPVAPDEVETRGV